MNALGVMVMATAKTVKAEDVMVVMEAERVQIVMEKGVLKKNNMVKILNMLELTKRCIAIHKILRDLNLMEKQLVLEHSMLPIKSLLSQMSEESTDAAKEKNKE